MKCKFRNVIVFGTGNVVGDRVRPALRSLGQELGIQRCVYVGIDSLSEVEKSIGRFDRNEVYYQNTNKELPFDWFETQNLLCDETLVLNCTPTELHVPIAMAIAPHVGRVAVEKPLSNDTREAAMLFEWDNIFPIGHQLWKPDVLALTKNSRVSGASPWSRFHALHFGLQETQDTKNRQIDSCTADLAWHGFELLLASPRAAGMSVSITVDSAMVGTYKNGPDVPTQTTAVAIDGFLVSDAFHLPYSVRCGKGLGASMKSLNGCAETETVLATLNDSASHIAHERLIRELLTSQDPNMQLDLRDVLHVVEACEEATRKACVMPEYEFGTTPRWLAFPNRKSRGPVPALIS